MVRRLMISLLCTLTVLGCADSAFGAAPGRDRAGVIHFAKSADSSFDRFSQAPTPARQQWMRTKYWRMRAYSPYFDTRTAWYQRAWFYKDAMAIYPGETGVPSDFYLRDAQGRKLYVWYDCGGGSCSQFAGDIGSPAFRAAWIADAKRSYAQGYQGLFVDDVNMQQRISDGYGNLQWPLDPRTGQLMNEQSWRRYMAEFMEQIRRELPGAEIVHNSLWFDGDADPLIRRQQDAADLIEIERGINDSGLRGGEGSVSVRTLLKLIDRLQARGKGVILDASAPSADERMYGLAGYFLISNGRDALGNNPAGTPEDWWAGYDTDLGEALGGRYDLPNGVIRRDFSGGTVLLNTPDTQTRTVALGDGYKDLAGVARTSVTLAPGTGIVLLRVGAVVQQPPTETETVVDPPAPVSPVDARSRRLRPRHPRRPRPRRPAKKQPVARVSRVGGKVKITGRVNGASTGSVQLVVQREKGRKWKTVKKVAARVAHDGSFSTTIKATAAGKHRVQAHFKGTSNATASISSFRTFTAR